MTVNDVNSHAFIKAYAAYLKKSGKLEVPKWVDIVKTATHKELGPKDPDWFYTRVGTAALAPLTAASLARQIYINKGLGVGSLQKSYGGRANRGVRPHHHHGASGSIIRKALQKIKVVEVSESGGRAITKQGQKDLDRIATQIQQANAAE